MSYLQENVGQWSRLVLNGQPLKGKRSIYIGSPALGWTDDLKDVTDYGWVPAAQDEASVQCCI